MADVFDSNRSRPTPVARDSAPEEPGRAGSTRRRMKPLLAADAMVDQFEVIRRIGKGGMGEIYLAHDTVLGRKVALKVIRPESLGSSQAVAQFLSEARVTARLNHPNIVTIHHAGEIDIDGRSAPYLALEYLEGDNLYKRMQERAISVAEALRIGVVVADALTEAHAHSVLHRDLKPENVVIPPDGRLRLLDFGLATVQAGADDGDLLVAPPAASDGDPGGTPAYMAPEQWTGGTCDGATDVWALGVMLFELIADRLPFAHKDPYELSDAVCSSKPAPRLDKYAEAPGDLADLVARCLSKMGGDRPTAAETAESLREITQQRRRGSNEQRSPFRGLMAFTQRDADMFFGRDAEIAKFVERVRSQPILPVVGPSGAGKSSFVQAGVVPRLREQEGWTVLRVRPGSRPFQALATRILWRESVTVGPSQPESLPPGSSKDSLPPSSSRRQPLSLPPRVSLRTSQRTQLLNQVDELASVLEQQPRTLALELRTMAEEQGMKVLLLVDQLEELFTLVDDPETQRRYMTALCTAADHAVDPVRVVFTVRDDFLGRIAVAPEVAEALAQVTVVQSLGEGALAETVERPVEAVGYRFDDPELARDMAAAVSGEPIALPLLQFCARMLWERRDQSKRLLLRSAYDDIGGVAGALATHADEVLEGMSPAELRVVRQLLLRLVTPGGTRRVVPTSAALEGLGEDGARVLTRLSKSRLVSVTKARGEVAGSSVLELAHESLIGSWSTLVDWIDASKEERGFLAETEQAAELWHRHGRRVAELWQGDALHDALRTAKRLGTELPELVRSFIDVSSAREQQQTRRRRMLLLSAAALLTFITASAVVATMLIADKEQEARELQQQAELQRAEAMREGARAAQQNGDLLEARAKLRLALERKDTGAARALWWQLTAEPLSWRRQVGDLVLAVTISPRGDVLATGCQDGAVCLFDPQTGAMRLLRGHRDRISSLAFSLDGTTIVSGSWDGEIRVWNVADGKLLSSIAAYDDRVRALVFVPNTDSFVSASRNGVVKRWRTSDYQSSWTIEAVGGELHSLSASPDGKLVASGSHDHSVKIWRTSDGGLHSELRGHDATVEGVDFTPDGKRLVSGSIDATLRVWNVASGRSERVLRGHSGGLRSVSVSPDGKKIASGSYDKTVRVWSSDSGEQLAVYRGEGAMRSVSFGPDGMLLAGSYDTTLRLWDTKRRARRAQGGAHQGGIRGLDFSPDDKTIVTGGFDHSVKQWDVASGRAVQLSSGHSAGVYGVRFSPDGKQIASASLDGSVRLWHSGSGQLARALDTGTPNYTVAFSPDGSQLAAGSRDHKVRIWNLDEGTLQSELEGHSNIIWDVNFSPDGKRLVSSGWEERVLLWDLSSGAIVHTLTGHQGTVFGASFGPDGKWIATGGADRTIRLWDTDNGSGRVVSTLSGRIYVLDFDGQRILAPTSDGDVHLIELGGGKKQRFRAHGKLSTVARISHSGDLLASASDDGVLKVWDAATGRPFWRAPLLLASPVRLLSHRGYENIEPGQQARAEWPHGSDARQLIEQRTRIAMQAGTDMLCVQTYDGSVELWDLPRDLRLAQRSMPEAKQLVATANGCAAHDGKEVRLLGPGGERGRVPVEGKPSAIGFSTDRLLVATADTLSIFDAAADTAKLLSKQRIDVGASALAFVLDQEGAGGRLLIGYRDGSVELLRSGGAPGSGLSLQQTPASAATRLLVGPMDTVIVGFANGVIGLWSQLDGSRVAHDHLHGALVHLLIAEQRLYAATDLGQHLSWDLSALYRDYCELLEEIWSHVPVVWEQGHALRAPSPADHPCKHPQ